MSLGALQSYEIVQGALVRWSVQAAGKEIPPPTAVLIHGILGAGRNWCMYPVMPSFQCGPEALMISDVNYPH